MTMKKLINNPENLTVELLEGMALAFPEKVKIVSDKIVCRATPKAENKVRIVTLGGAGHEPALSGFVGEGMLDYSVVGDIFAAPGAPKVFEALKMANCEAGVLFIVLNHEGDVMSANMAMEMAKREGLEREDAADSRRYQRWSGCRGERPPWLWLVVCLFIKLPVPLPKQV